MNKGTGVGTGPTAAAAAAAAQKQKTMMQRVETDIANIVDNFTQLVNAARVTLYFKPITTISSSLKSLMSRFLNSPKWVFHFVSDFEFIS